MQLACSAAYCLPRVYYLVGEPVARIKLLSHGASAELGGFPGITDRIINSLQWIA